MKEYPAIVRSLIVRVVIAATILVAGFRMLEWSFVLVAPFLILLAAVLVATPIAQLLGGGTGSLFFPNRHFDRPQPMYGIPQARRAEGHYDEAMRELERIGTEYPGEVQAWIDMIDIAVVNLNDAQRAEAIYVQGMNVLKRTEQRESLTTMYHAIRSRLKTS